MAKSKLARIDKTLFSIIDKKQKELENKTKADLSFRQASRSIAEEYMSMKYKNYDKCRDKLDKLFNL